MGLKKYDVTVNGTPTTLLLSDTDAAAQGLTPRSEKASSSPAPTASTTAAKKAAPAKKAPAKKAAPKPANKSRTAQDK